MESYDLLLRGGHVIDPASGFSAMADIAIKNGKILQIGQNLPSAPAKRVADVAGCIVAPGMIDLHCHIFPRFPSCKDGLPNVNADAHMFPSGVTTAVDAGSCGWRDFGRFKEEVIDVSKVRVLAMVNIAQGGMVNLESEQRPRDFHPKIAAAIAQTFPDIVVGIKAAHYWGDRPFDAEHPPWASVDQGLEAAELCGKLLMVDFKPNLPECSYERLVLKKLRPGDIHTHMYAEQFPVLNEEGNVQDFLFEARRRGVHFDLGHGAGSFWFRSAIPAFEQGFGPDTLSTDLYMANVKGPSISLVHIMSKYLNIGMTMEELIARVTMHSAKVIGHSELGTLSVGGCADVAVLLRKDEPCGFTDCGNASMRGHASLSCELTVRAGDVVYDPHGRSMPDWKTAPAEYWKSPGVIHW